jgi:hypothetical protein
VPGCFADCMQTDSVLVSAAEAEECRQARWGPKVARTLLALAGQNSGCENDGLLYISADAVRHQFVRRRKKSRRVPKELTAGGVWSGGGPVWTRKQTNRSWFAARAENGIYTYASDLFS